MKIKPKGYFITLEGGEGTGKSTQAKKIYNYLLKKNIPTVLTREPGGCKEAEQIRNLLVKGKKNKWDGIGESLLLNAARRVHLKNIIIPALNKNNWVICDRFIDSTMAYQGVGYGVSMNFLNNLSKIVCEGITPDLTFIFDMNVNDSLKRTKNRTSNNRYEKFDIEYHSKINNYFKSLPNKNKRYCKVNADDNIDNVFKNIIDEITKRKNI